MPSGGQHPATRETLRQTVPKRVSKFAVLVT